MLEPHHFCPPVEVHHFCHRRRHCCRCQHLKLLIPLSASVTAAVQQRYTDTTSQCHRHHCRRCRRQLTKLMLRPASVETSAEVQCHCRLSNCITLPSTSPLLPPMSPLEAPDASVCVSVSGCAAVACNAARRLSSRVVLPSTPLPPPPPAHEADASVSIS